MAYMATGNGVGFEIFEFIDPKPQPAELFQHERKGSFHLCVMDPSPDELADKVKADGGRQTGKTVDPSGNGDIRCLYLSDPWGNIVEVLS